MSYDYNNVMETPAGMAPLQQNAISQQTMAPVAGATNVAGAAAAGIGTIPGAPAAGAGIGPGFFKNADGSFNTGNAQLVLGGIQTIGSLWNSFQQQKLAKETFAFNKQAYQTNLDNQRSTYNTALEDRIRARYATEGRSEQADSYIDNHSL